jgi:peptide methionine sulfoxide reductase msrA/msrB
MILGNTPHYYGRLQQQSSLTVATFAGGCFWCMEGPFEELPGVKAAIAGYAGGNEPNPTYEQVSLGHTNHREAVQVFYDSSQVKYETLLDTYWLQVDPTDTNGQFADKGMHYTTAIFYHTREQQQLAEASKRALANSGRFEKPIVTEILPFKNFFIAEEYHQDYYKKNILHYQMYKQGSGRAKFIEENKKFRKSLKK